MRFRVLSFLFILTLLLSMTAQLAQAQAPVVHAVLFFSPTCPHCHEVMEKDLPPLAEKYGEQLDIVGIDVSQPAGMQLYQNMALFYNVPNERIGVPTLVVGDQVLVGSAEIPEQFPQIVASGLAAGGIDWPGFPGLAEVLAVQNQQSPAPSQAETPPPVQQSETTPTVVQKFNQDPVANTIAVVVLIGMLLAVFAVIYTYIKGDESKFLSWPDWIIPLLAVVGMAVALYLSYIEFTRSEAVCGPVGNCNSVQESPYAYLFGVIPIGVMGLFGYAAILVAWLLKNYGPASLRKLCTLLIWGFGWFGVLFSIYLTFLEPFVIGATCAWCITSAIVMTLIFLASTEPAKQALKVESTADDLEDDFEEEEAEAEKPEGAQSDEA